MIKNVKLTNFRQHTDKTFNFTEGLVLLRGMNESGKSTVIESVLYALYGSKALRDSLAETVTWGQKEGSLKVELVIAIDGVDYTFKRSKAGAEVQWVKHEGYLVTGQNEVSAFAAQLLGADAKTASSLMLADQSGLRGALDDGPTAVSGLMSKLADFSLIDRIVEEMQATLLLGADAPIREKLKAAQEELDLAMKESPDPKVVAAAKEKFAQTEKRLAEAVNQRATVEAPAYNKTSDALADADAAEKAYAAVVAEVDRVQARLGEVVTALDDAKARVVPVDTARIEALRRDLFDIAEETRRASAWSEFQRLPQVPEQHWDGDQESFVAEVRQVRKELADLNQKRSDLASNISRLEGQKINGGVCKTCGTDVSKRDDIVAKNAAIDAELTTLGTSLSGAVDAHKALSAHLDTLEAIERTDRKYASLVSNYLAQFVKLQYDTVPPSFVWVGGDGYVRPDADKIKEELAALETAASASQKAEGEVTALTKALTQARDDLHVASERLKATPNVDVAPFQAAFAKASAALEKIDEVIWDREKIHGNVKEQYDSMVLLTRTLQARIDAANLRIAEYEKDIEAVGFNNTLLKKMRAIKPSVTDHLWNSVLAAVSQFFTQLRGEASVVTKDSDGFKVNGNSVKSLSGSTLDILALAVRVALTKTFIPNTSLLVLDEPAYGCDVTRTASMLGFLSSVGFTQVVLASHDELSESVADSVVVLGE